MKKWMITLLIFLSANALMANDQNAIQSKSSDELTQSGEVPHFENGKPVGYTKINPNGKRPMQKSGIKHTNNLVKAMPTPSSTPQQ